MAHKNQKDLEFGPILSPAQVFAKNIKLYNCHKILQAESKNSERSKKTAEY
jgi:hypothetical protein